MVEAESVELPTTRVPLDGAKNRWNRRSIYLGAVCVVTLCIAIAAVASPLKMWGAGEVELSQNIQIVHLPDGKIELGYASQNPQMSEATNPQRGLSSGDFVPGGAAFREGYTFAARAAPQQFPQSYSSDPAQVWQAKEEEEEQNQLRARQPIESPLQASSQAAISPQEYQSMIEKLTQIHQQQDLESFKQKQLAAQVSASADPELLSNQIMRSEAGELEKSYELKGAKGAGGEQPSATLTTKRARTEQLSQLPSQMWQAPSFPATVAAPPPQPVLSSNVHGASTEVEINALQARLQADEVAIATLTKDVQELRQQNAELLEHEQGPGPASASAPPPGPSAPSA